MVVGLNGRTFSNGNTNSSDFLQTQSWYPRLLNSNGEIVFIPPHLNSNRSDRSNKNDKVISIAKPILEQDRVIGFIIADVRGELLNDIFSINLKNKASMLVADNNEGEIIFEPENGGLPEGLSNKSFLDIFKKMSENQGSFYSELDTEDVLTIYRKSALTNF
jgi:two-component system sensor histidine kinase YesM